MQKSIAHLRVVSSSDLSEIPTTNTKMERNRRWRGKRTKIPNTQSQKGLLYKNYKIHKAREFTFRRIFKKCLNSSRSCFTASICMYEWLTDRLYIVGQGNMFFMALKREHQPCNKDLFAGIIIMHFKEHQQQLWKMKIIHATCLILENCCAALFSLSWHFENHKIIHKSAYITIATTYRLNDHFHYSLL